MGFFEILIPERHSNLCFRNLSLLIPHLIAKQDGHFAFYDASSFRSYLGFMQSAKDMVESSSSNELEIVLLPPNSGHKTFESDENGDENEFDEDYVPEETADKVEIHEGEFHEVEIQETISESGKRKKSKSSSLGDANLIAKLNIIKRLAESSMYDFFFSSRMI